jgi:GTP-binding protein
VERPAIVGISSATGAGLDELIRAIFDALPSELAVPASAGEFEAEHRVYRPGEEEGFDVVSEGDGRFRVAGRGIELLVARHDLENEEALDYLEGRLREIGVIAALQRAGFEPGDEVVVGDLEFELDPG